MKGAHRIFFLYETFAIIMHGYTNSMMLINSVPYNKVKGERLRLKEDKGGSYNILR